MGIKNKFLITGMVATALTIEFLEWGTVQLSGPFLYGDENGVSLILKKDDDTFVIQTGEKGFLYGKRAPEDCRQKRIPHYFNPVPGQV